MESAELSYPVLEPRYEAALLDAVGFILREFKPFCIIASGSIIRGNPDPSSDLDLVVLHDGSWRRRIQKWFGDVPAEIFINSPDWIERYLLEEEKDGRPIMAHMLTTGFVVYSSSLKTGELIGKARASIERGASFTEAHLERQRYSAACLFEDALEFAERDEATAAVILGRGVDAAIRYWFQSRRRFAVRSKEQLSVIRKEDAATATLIERTMLAATISDRMLAARELAVRVVGHVGFFEWDSGPDTSQ